MLTKLEHIEDWIKDNGLTWWKFCLEQTGVIVKDDGTSEQRRSNQVIVLSDAYAGDLEEKIRLTKKRLALEKSIRLFGQGKRGKENTGLMYCEVRLDDVDQQPGTYAVSSVSSMPAPDEETIAARIRKEIMAEIQLQKYEDERKSFEKERREFEAAKSSAIGMLVQYLSPVVAALSGKPVAGVDAHAPVHAAPVQPITTIEQPQEDMGELFTEQESDQLFDLMARFKAVEPQYLQLIEKVVEMAEAQDSKYNMAKTMLL